MKGFENPKMFKAMFIFVAIVMLLDIFSEAHYLMHSVRIIE